jgi:hypothetical protein
MTTGAGAALMEELVAGKRGGPLHQFMTSRLRSATFWTSATAS